MAIDDGLTQWAIPTRLEARRAIVQALCAPSSRCSDPGRIAEVSLSFVSKSEIADLNASYRQQARPTNCLSFPQDSLPAIFRRDLLGDIVIAPEVVQQEAAEQGKSPSDHYRHLLIHSTLHLLGYDHIEDAEASAMEALEVSLLAEMGVADPYLNQIHE
jgi:probable rRNA maturation factor